MRIIYLLIFCTFGAFAQSNQRIQILPHPKSIEDFEHLNRGCPENSECDKSMGEDLLRWQGLVTKISDESMTQAKRSQFLEAFRNAYGIPVEFYTNKSSQQGFKPLLFSSACKAHNPSDEQLKILRGKAFVKELNLKRALVWRNGSPQEVSIGAQMNPRPVIVYYPDGPQTYYLPLEDQPLMIKGKELYVLRDEETIFYVLKVTVTGEWKIVDFDLSELSKYEDKRENVKCPAEKTKTSSTVFQVDFCKTVWDEDLKKPVVVKMSEGCAI